MSGHHDGVEFKMAQAHKVNAITGASRKDKIAAARAAGEVDPNVEPSPV